MRRLVFLNAFTEARPECLEELVDRVGAVISLAREEGAAPVIVAIGQLDRAAVAYCVREYYKAAGHSFELTFDSGLIHLRVDGGLDGWLGFAPHGMVWGPRDRVEALFARRDPLPRTSSLARLLPRISRERFSGVCANDLGTSLYGVPSTGSVLLDDEVRFLFATPADAARARDVAAEMPKFAGHPPAVDGAELVIRTRR